MLRISSNSLGPNDEEFPEGAHILVLHGGDADFVGHGLCHDVFFTVCLPRRAVRKRSGHGTGPCGDCFPDLQSLADPFNDGVVIPCRVGDCDEKGLADEPACFPVDRALLRKLFTVNGDPLAHINKKILKIGRSFRFSADTLYRTPLVLRCFLALKTIHCFPSFLIFKPMEMNRPSAHFPYPETASPAIFGRTLWSPCP